MDETDFVLIVYKKIFSNVIIYYVWTKEDRLSVLNDQFKKLYQTLKRGFYQVSKRLEDDQKHFCCASLFQPICQCLNMLMKQSSSCLIILARYYMQRYRI